MKALEQIIRRVAENPSRPWALATLVKTKGSTYRKTGARLLVDSEGSTLGVLSGGCLEEEIGRHGRNVIAGAAAVLLSFDTKRLYGCDGHLKILVRPLPAAEPKAISLPVGRLLRIERSVAFEHALKTTRSVPSCCLLMCFWPSGAVS
jgi:xanthine/CO dehydrogenase XdhC/CoxF family maturation factor